MWGVPPFWYCGHFSEVWFGSSCLRLTVLPPAYPSWPLWSQQWRRRRWRWRPRKLRRSWPRERFWVSWPTRLRWRKQTSAKSWIHWLRSAPRRWRSLASSFSLACAWSRLALRQLSKEEALACKCCRFWHPYPDCKLEFSGGGAWGRSKCFSSWGWRVAHCTQSITCCSLLFT